MNILPDLPPPVASPTYLRPKAGELTAREIVQNFKNLVAAGRPSDEVRISDRQWLFNLDHQRARLLRQQMEKGQSINEAFVQEVGVLDEDTQERTVAIKKQKCGRWYTQNPIPGAVECYQQNLLTFVGTPGGHAFQKTNAQRAEWEQYAKYTKRRPKWYQLGNTIYLVTPPSPGINQVAIRGVFENPRAVHVYNGTELDALDYLNFPYPISRTALDTITKMLVDGELKLALALPYDYQNDGRETHEPSSNA